MFGFDGFIARLGYVMFTCITSTILFGLTSIRPNSFRFFTTSRYGTAIYFDIKFLAPKASRRETATEMVQPFYRVRISIA